MDRHDDIREQLTDYALGEVPADARERIRVHLAGCAECAAEARELSAAFQGIGFAEAPSAPPTDLRARVLAQLEREPQLDARPAVLSRQQTRKPRGWVVQPAWVALAATAVLVLGGLIAVSQQRAARLADDLRRADATAARLAAEAATVATQADLAVSILTAPDMRRIDLEGFDASRNATARAYWSAANGLLIVADRLPAPAPGRIYQVWLIGGGTGPVSAGLIPGGGSRGMLIAPPPGRISGGTITIAVTDEPEGGVPAPTGSKHLVGSL